SSRTSDLRRILPGNPRTTRPNHPADPNQPSAAMAGARIAQARERRNRGSSPGAGVGDHGRRAGPIDRVGRGNRSTPGRASKSARSTGTPANHHRSDPAVRVGRRAGVRQYDGATMKSSTSACRPAPRRTLPGTDDDQERTTMTTEEPEPSAPRTTGPQPAEGAEIGALIGAGFGLLFLIINSTQFSSLGRTLVLVLGIVAFAGIAVFAVRGLVQQRRVAAAEEPEPAGTGERDRGQLPFGRAYWIIVAIEAIALFAGAR